MSSSSAIGDHARISAPPPPPNPERIFATQKYSGPAAAPTFEVLGSTRGAIRGEDDGENVNLGNVPPPTPPSLRSRYPELVQSYHPAKNIRKSIAVPFDSKTPLWWKCGKGPDHEWQCTIEKRLQGEVGDCPCCRNIKTSGESRERDV